MSSAELFERALFECAHSELVKTWFAAHAAVSGSMRSPNSTHPTSLVVIGTRTDRSNDSIVNRSKGGGGGKNWHRNPHEEAPTSFFLSPGNFLMLEARGAIVSVSSFPSVMSFTPLHFSSLLLQTVTRLLRLGGVGRKKKEAFLLARNFLPENEESAELSR